MGRWSGKSCRLSTMMMMTASFFLVEIIVGYVTNSIALVADSFHMLSDVVALIVGFASVRISKWKTKRNTYGWQRAEVLGALVNSVFLLALCFSILVESLKRLVEVEEVENPIMLLVVGIMGLLINLVGLCLFGEHGHSHGGSHGHSHGGHGHSHGHSHNDNHQDKGEGHQDHPDHETTKLKTNGIQKDSAEPYTSMATNASSESTLDEDKEIYTLSNGVQAEIVKHSAKSLNMRGVFLHVLGDALGSVVVVISALAIMLVEGDWKYYLDPAMSILMVIIILLTTVPLFRETAYILLQTVPRHVDVEAITRELKEIDGIAGVHECHIWQLAGRRIIASAHIHCKDIIEYMTLANKIKDVFHRAGIHSTTIQPEFVQNSEDQKSCLLQCASDNGDMCEQDTCCGPLKTSAGKSLDRLEGINNSNSNDVLQLLPSTFGNNHSNQHQPQSSMWHMEMSPEGDEVVLDLSKME